MRSKQDERKVLVCSQSCDVVRCGVMSPLIGVLEGWATGCLGETGRAGEMEELYCM